MRVLTKEKENENLTKKETEEKDIDDYRDVFKIEYESGRWKIWARQIRLDTHPALLPFVRPAL